MQRRRGRVGGRARAVEPGTEPGVGGAAPNGYQDPVAWPRGTALGWFPWHFPAAALPAPKAVIKCTQTHNYRGAVAGGHASSAGVLGALPLCTCLCSNAKGDVSCCCDACAACTASRQGTDQSPHVPRQGRDHVPHAPGRAGISAPMSPGRTAISISPWPQAGQGSVSPGTPRPCRDLQQGREETGVSVPSGNPPYSIPTAPPPHVPHLTLHMSHPCGVTPLHDTKVGCRLLRGGSTPGWLPAQLEQSKCYNFERVQK